MRKICSTFLLFFVLIPLWADKSVILPELNRPTAIEADQQRVYIVDNTSVLIYSIKDFKLLKKVGRKGEGPQEFKHITSIHLLKDSLLVNSRGKVSFFSKDGAFIKELKAAAGSDFIRLGDQFIGMDMEMVNKQSNLTINLYDSNLAKIKELSRRTGSFLGSKSLDPIIIYGPLGPELRVLGEQIIIKSNDGKFKVLSGTGKLITTLSPKYKKLQVTETHRAEILDFYRTNPRTKANYPALKKRFKFPESFPSVRNYNVDNNRVYILTFHEKAEKRKFLVYNIQGDFVKEIFLPLAETNILELYPYTIKNSRVYQLVEDEEDWKITLTAIKSDKF